jgi:hypothetical protein
MAASARGRHYGLVFFATRVADDAIAVVFLNQHVTPEPGHHQAGFSARDGGPCLACRFA